MDKIEVKLSKAEVRLALQEAARAKLLTTINGLCVADYHFLSTDISPLSETTLVELEKRLPQQ